MLKQLKFKIWAKYCIPTNFEY